MRRVKNLNESYQETIYDPFSFIGHALTAWGDWTNIALKTGGLYRNPAVYRSYQETIKALLGNV